MTIDEYFREASEGLLPRNNDLNINIKMMERPEVIKQKIVELTELLKKSEEFYSFKKLTDSRVGLDEICPFDIGKIRLVLNKLSEGKELMLKHEYCGNAKFKLNPQQNRIIVSSNSQINENNICNFILWNYGEFYVSDL